MDVVIKKNLEKTAVLVLGYFIEKSDKIEKTAGFSDELLKELQDAIATKRFKQEFNEIYVTNIPTSGYKRVLVINLGKPEQLTLERIRRVMAKIVNYVKATKLGSFTTRIPDMFQEVVSKKPVGFTTELGNILTPKAIGRVCAEGLYLCDYGFKKYVSKKENGGIENAYLVYTGSKEFEQGIMDGKIIADATNYARDLVNEPANVVTPAYLENEAKFLAKRPKIKVRILNNEQLKKEGLNALIGVGQGGDFASRLIIIEYAGAGAGEKTAIVGKGLTFDSGGYNIKSGASLIQEMKMDMAGAAAVLGTIRAASALNIKSNIIGVIPACENMVDSSAQRPGDIVKAYNGKTIEVYDTDAEGRLVLADAMSYVEKNYHPKTIIDLATLTGACIVALGYYVAGMVSNSDSLSKELITAGNESYDRVWSLPFFEEYWSIMDGDITDLRNLAIGGHARAAGAITAAVFLSKFVDLEKTRWAHLDIAGSAYLNEAKDYNPKSATGSGVRLLTYYFMK